MVTVASFEQVAASFWHADIQYGMLPRLTQDMASTAERELGLVLPADLLRLLNIQNGGVVADAWDACPIDTTVSAGDYVPFGELFGIGPRDDAQSVITLLDTPYLVQEWDLPTPVLLLSGQGHYWVALDYRDCGPDGSPSVIWLDDAREDEMPLAPDFRTFMEQLRPEAGYMPQDPGS